jgi:hypothetical protein
VTYFVKGFAETHNQAVSLFTTVKVFSYIIYKFDKLCITGKTFPKSMLERMLLVMMCSINLQAIHVRDTQWTVIYSLKFLAFLKDGTNKSSFPNTGYFSGVVGFPEYGC